MKSEPSIILGAITAVAVAVLAALVAFGMNISDAQQTAILAIIAAVAPLVLGLVTRGKVFAPANVAAAVTPAGRVVAGPAVDVMPSVNASVGQSVAVVPMSR